ncbi:MAG: M23 family metallopeptidase [Ruminococcaceae bacterium]|nr:M23 family metallopeptidase [Oscillospiraceae bacterium]
MKKVYIVIICALFAFIPTYIAIASFFSTQAQPVKQDTVDKLEIIAPNGIYSEITRNNDTAGFIEFAVEMNETAQKILALPDPLLDDPYFSFTYHSYGKSSEYKYYFTSHSPDAYFVDSTGLPYHITKESAEKFLKSKYAHCIFDYSSAPIMTVNTSVIAPNRSDWEFKGYNGEYTDALSITGSNDMLETYGMPTINFDIEPDTISVKIYENGNTLYDGYYSELSNEDFSGHVADAHVIATWYDSADRDYRGEIEYKFPITFKKSPVFFISSSSAITGDLITVSVLNSENLSAINLVSEPSLGVDPIFYNDGDYARALIPVSSALIPGTYKLTADYNGQSTTEFSIEISGKYTANYPYNVEDSVFASQYTEANINSYQSLFKSFFNDLSETKLFDGKFTSGLPSGTFESADYGDLLTISANDIPFENPGVYYSCTKVSNVSAVNAGKVIYTGSDALAGNIVAIDHGLGLVSVYKHLGSISVKAGDSVLKGDLIGVSGRTGFMSKKSAHITVARVELYADMIPVDIDPLIENGLEVTK